MGWDLVQPPSDPNLHRATAGTELCVGRGNVTWAPEGLLPRLTSAQKMSRTHMPPHPAPRDPKGLYRRPCLQETHHPYTCSSSHTALMLLQGVQRPLPGTRFPPCLVAWPGASPDTLRLFLYLYCDCSSCERHHRIGDCQLVFSSLVSCIVPFAFLCCLQIFADRAPRTTNIQRKLEICTRSDFVFPRLHL